MSQSFGPKLAALIGAATLSAAAPTAALHQEQPASHEAEQQLPAAAKAVPATLGQTVPATLIPQCTHQVEVAGPTLESIIEQRLAQAQRASRYDDIDALGTLWMTLERRGQLDRQVERADQFLNVALRNQKRSELRSDVRRHKHAPYSTAEIDVPAPAFSADQALDAEQFIADLEEPYRSAVLWTLTGRNNREVASEMDASHAAVRKWAQRLRDKLRAA